MLSVGAVFAVPLGLVLVLLSWVVGLPWWTGAVLGAVVTALVLWRRARRADVTVLEPYRSLAGTANPDPVVVARFGNLVEGLCLSIGIPEPELLVVSDPARNAMAVARDQRQTLVVTDSLLTDLERVELEGVVAELLVRLRSGDAERATVMAALVGGLLLDSALGSVGRPLAARLMRRTLDDYRDVTADRQAVAVTRYPPGLWAGLERIGSGPVLPVGATPGTDHLWMVPPPRAADLFDFAPLEWRIDILMES
ncbi:MAG: hypothetical protein O3C27_04180 [Actinomycetota bacterium]|nr:hypothetical protein [Actinomycetota bacterium]